VSNDTGGTRIGSTGHPSAGHLGSPHHVRGSADSVDCYSKQQKKRSIDVDLGQQEYELIFTGVCEAFSGHCGHVYALALTAEVAAV